MKSLIIVVSFLLAAGIVTYKVARAIARHWHDVKSSLLVVLALALCTTTFLVYIDEYPGFKGKMLDAGDWIFAGIYTIAFFTIFSGLFFLARNSKT